MSSEKSDRLSELHKVSNFSAFNPEHVKEMNSSIGQMPKWKQRSLRKGQAKIAKAYNYKMKKLYEGGANWSVDKLVREMAMEYTHRYASGGRSIQPSHFQFFEPFLHIKLIQQVAPYATIERENNHIFHLRDFLDYVTSEKSDGFEIRSLVEFPKDEIFHFSVNGNINDISFSNSDNRDMIISGFSMIRRNSSIHWYLVAGETFSKDDWFIAEEDQITSDNAITFNPLKEKMLEKATQKNGNYFGQRVALDGIDNTQRIIIAGEFDLFDMKHVSRCLLSEYEHCFSSHTDNLDILSDIPQFDIENFLSASEEKFQSCAALWSIAESFFQLPAYFNKSLALNRNTAGLLKKRISKKKGGKGIASNYTIIQSLNPKSLNANLTIEEIVLPHYKIEVEGHWRIIGWDQLGTDRHGNPISGKTWIPSKTKLKRSNGDNIIYVKDTLASAEIKIEGVLEDIKQISEIESSDDSQGELYIMRSPSMEENIFKVGFTTKTSEERAKQLSSSTGVAKPFTVLKKWKFKDAQKLETDVHIGLLAYRIEDSREFFKVEQDVIEKVIELSLLRHNRS